MVTERDATIRMAARDELAALEPLWKSLQQHHARITPKLGPSRKREPEDSWRRRVAKYTRWTEDPDTFVVLAERGGQAIGYAFVTLKPGHASWASGDRIAELETLAVLPQHRRQGVGAALLGAVKARLEELEVKEVTVTATVSNRDARRFYEHHGLEPAFHVFYGRLNAAP